MKTKRKQKLKLFVWDSFSPDWSSGLAFAIASSEEKAKKIIIKKLGHVPYEWGDVEVYSLNKSIGFGRHGGG
jgi:hypothetical protein